MTEGNEMMHTHTTAADTSTEGTEVDVWVKDLSTPSFRHAPTRDPMMFRELRRLIRTDLYRYFGKASAGFMVKMLLYPWAPPGFKYTTVMRWCNYLETMHPPWLGIPLFTIFRLLLLHWQFKFGIEISPRTKIGSGFYIGHCGLINVSAETVIGKNCNLSQGVLIGRVNRGKYKGFPTLGDNVFVGPGAKILGRIHIGNNAAIGANCVVTKDMPDNAVVVGIPGKVISLDGSDGYINHTDY